MRTRVQLILALIALGVVAPQAANLETFNATEAFAAEGGTKSNTKLDEVVYFDKPEIDVSEYYSRYAYGVSAEQASVGKRTGSIVLQPETGRAVTTGSAITPTNTTAVDSGTIENVQSTVAFGTTDSGSDSAVSATESADLAPSASDAIVQVTPPVANIPAGYSICEPDNMFSDTQEGIYNYCPSVIGSEDNFSVFYCSNTDSYNVTDSIYYRNYIRINDDWYGSPKIKVLTASSGGWDSKHVCDPTVVKGNFSYGGTSYQYLMAYLGCSSTDNQRNSVGLAVSNSLGSGWVKVNESNPFIAYSWDDSKTDSFQWGVGQASLLSIDGAGKVAIFYTEGTWNLTTEKVQVWDLSNLDSPQLITVSSVSNAGTQNLNGGEDFISNADFMWQDGRLYMVCDTHPYGGSVLNCVPSTSRVYRTSISLEDIAAGATDNVQWTLVGEVSSAATGKGKNHNCGLGRDVYGRGSGAVTVFYTGATEKSDFASSLWTYRIYQTVL